jgi:polyribonucleotide nucleotidyltransferase
MKQTMPAPRSEVGETAPKIVSFEIPIDKIGEVIGPKGKVINTIQQETGAEIAVDDDGVVGTVTIGSPDGRKVAEARRQIELIVNPPTARPGEVYTGRVVNITKFGAFVNILPGRDGLVHISKLGKGRRINRVEDVLELGDTIEVRVDDIDPNGKVSLSPIGDDWEGSGGGDAAPARPASDRPASDRPTSDRPAPDRAPVASSGDELSFEAAFESEAREAFGDLGPAGEARSSSGGGESRDGGRRRRHR